MTKNIRGFKLTATQDLDSTNTIIHDLYINAAGNFEMLYDETIEEQKRAAMQEITTRLLLIKGEYFLDLREGIPMFEEILVKHPNIGRIKQIIKEAIMSVPVVQSIDTVSVVFNQSTRNLSLTFNVVLYNGLKVNSSDFGQLIISPKTDVALQSS